jgi:hypothetical protein
VFLAATLVLPQRAARASNTAVADEMAASLAKTVAELKQQQMVAPEQEKALEEAIERIRQSARQRVDASSWEAADALREKMAADVADKQNAAKWAQESLARYAAAARGAGGAPPANGAEAAELTKALEQLAKSGLLAGAPESLKASMMSGKLPADAASLRELTASLGKYLRETNGRFGEVGKLGKEFGPFQSRRLSTRRAVGGWRRGSWTQRRQSRPRADAELTWGKKRRPSISSSPRRSRPAPRAARRLVAYRRVAGRAAGVAGLERGRHAREECADAVGQGAWRRALAPRHQSAVRK